MKDIGVKLRSLGKLLAIAFIGYLLFMTIWVNPALYFKIFLSVIAGMLLVATAIRLVFKKPKKNDKRN